MTSLPDPPSVPEADAGIRRAARGLEDAVVPATFAEPSEPRYHALVGNVRTTGTELVRRLLERGSSAPVVREHLGEVVARGARRGRFSAERVAALLRVVVEGLAPLLRGP